MAEKWHLDTTGSIAYSKLPRLEAAPGHTLMAGMCRSSGLPGHVADGRYSYQGTYFSYPLQCNESSELLTQWSPGKPYMPCMDEAINQQLRLEKARCMLYRQESENFGMWGQNSSYEKNMECLAGDTLAAPEKWANYTGRADIVQPGWIPGFPTPPSAHAPTGRPTLAAPKPVYRNHVYCTDAASLASGTEAELPLKRPADMEWSLASSGYPVHGSYGSAPPQKAPVAESGFFPLHPDWKDVVASPAGFSPFCDTFENRQVPPSAPLVGASYPAGYNHQKSVPVESTQNHCRKAWPKLPPPAGSLAGSQGFIGQERSPACYPSYPLTSHEQLMLYQQNIAQAEKQKTPFALPACKSFNCPTSEDPKLLPKTYFPPAPQRYYPGHRESYFYGTLGSSPVTSPGLKTSREHTSQQNSHAKSSFDQRTPIPACSVAEKASHGGSLHNQEGRQYWTRSNCMGKSVDESFRCWQAASQPHAFHRLDSVEKLPSSISDDGDTPEAKYNTGLFQQEKGPSREKGSLSAEKQSGLSPEDKKRNTNKTPQSGACIAIPDSPVVSHDSYLKGDSLRAQISEGSNSSIQHDSCIKEDSLRAQISESSDSSIPHDSYLKGDFLRARISESSDSSVPHDSCLKGNSLRAQISEGSDSSIPRDSSLKGDLRSARISEGSDSSTQSVLQPHDKEPKDLKQPEDLQPPSSPPMPVIHNVFSLAPYREYLEGSVASVQLLSPKRCPAEKPSLEKSWQSTEGKTFPRPPSAGLSKAPGLDGGKDAACKAVAEVSGKDSSGSCVVTKKESKSYAGFCESYQACQNAPAASLRGATDCSSELSRDGHVLDLSIKAEGLADGPHVQKLAGKTEALKRETGKRKGEDVKEGTAKEQEGLQGTNSLALQPPLKSSSEEKGNFQSSAAFLYKKFKIQKCPQAAGSGSAMQLNILSFQSASHIAVLSNNFCLEQGSRSSEQAGAWQNSQQVAATQQNSLPLQLCFQQAVSQQNSLPLQQSCQQAVTQQNSLPLQQSCRQAVTQQNSLPLQQSCQQAVTPQHNLPVLQSCQQMATQRNSQPVQQSCQKTVIQRNSLPMQQISQQVVTRRNSLPVQQSFPQVVTRQKSLPAPQIAHETSGQPNIQLLLCRGQNMKQSDASKHLPPTAPASSPILGEVSASVPPSNEIKSSSSKKYFTDLHTSICTVISDSVSASSPELLREWLEKAEPTQEPKPKAPSPAKAKNGPKAPEGPKPPKSEQVWLAFKGVPQLLSQLVSQLETFVFTCHCPFPHVVRAGTIFVPIHLVKQKLFGRLPGAWVDHVLQDHKVELRPTTLSEEKLLRERDLKTCTSRMLKLLALKQLPDIYPDLLDYHWRQCIKQQLGSSSQAGLNAPKVLSSLRTEEEITKNLGDLRKDYLEKGDSAEEIWNGDLTTAGTEGMEIAEVAGCLESTTHASSLGVEGKCKQGGKCEPLPRDETPGSPSENHRPTDDPWGLSSSSQRSAASTQIKLLLREVAASVAVRTKYFPLHSGAKRLLFRVCRLPGTLGVQLTDGVARSSSKLPLLRKSIARNKFQNSLRDRWGRPVLVGKKGKRPASLLLKRFWRTGVRRCPSCPGYPELVGKRIWHLYKEKDGTKVRYRGLVLRVHKCHKDPLKTVFEVKYDSDPEWGYYLEVLQDYQNGWLEVE